MTSESQPAARVAGSKFSQRANSVVISIARHWLAIFNTAWAVYLFTPFLAPIFMQLGWTVPAQAVYSLYSFLCHQLPSHSYFLFGPELAPQTPALVASGMRDSNNLFVLRAFIGNPEVGWKVALCQRDVAIYASVLVSGIIFGLVRDRLRPLPFKYYLIFLIPIAIDGLTQLVGFRESNWWLRTVTGALFGFASVWLAYPYVDDAMQEVIEEETARRQRALTPPPNA
jgi:uncharacterized membrane protein